MRLSKENLPLSFRAIDPKHTLIHLVKILIILITVTAIETSIHEV